MMRSATLVRTTLAGLCLAGSLLAPFRMTAQIDRRNPPQPGPAPAVQLGSHTSFTLPNGMRVIVVENHKLPLTSVQVRFDIPPVRQGDKTGYIDLMGDLLATGTATRSKAQIDEAVEKLGGALYTSSDGAYTAGLKKHLPALLEVLQDVVTAPSFPERELEKARTRYRSSVQQRKDDPDAIAEAVGRAATYGRTHPYGEVMSERTLDNVALKHIQGYYQRFFRPEKGYLVFVGDITVKEAKALAKKSFGAWKPAMPPVTVDDNGNEIVEGLGTVEVLKQPVTAAGVRRVQLVDRPGSAQSVIRVTYPLNLQPKDNRALAAQVMNTILGGGVFNARLMQNLREDKAWTYGAYSSLDADRFNGSFTASVSVRNAVTDSALVEIVKELERMRTEGVTAEELELAKKFMAGSFARSLEDPRTVARFALNTYLNGLAEDHYATYLQRLEAITVADVKAAAEAFLQPDNAVLFVVGDKEEIYQKLVPLSRDVTAPVFEVDENGEPWNETLTPVSDRTADQIIDAYIEAIGGRAAAAKLTDVKLVYTTSVAGMPLTITQWYGAGGRFRSETKMGDQVVGEEVFDGTRGRRNGPEGPFEVMDADLDDMRFNALLVPELDIKKHIDMMVLGGSIDLQGRKAYKLAMTTHAMQAVEDYFHADTGLRIRRIERKYAMGRPMTITTDFKDHRQVGGVLLPHTIEQGGGPMGVVVLTLKEATVLTKPQPASFYETGLPPVVEEE